MDNLKLVRANDVHVRGIRVEFFTTKIFNGMCTKKQLSKLGGESMGRIIGKLWNQTVDANSY